MTSGLAVGLAPPRALLGGDGPGRPRVGLGRGLFPPDSAGPGRGSLPGAGGKTGGSTGEDEAMTHYADYAESRADRAADQDDNQPLSIGLGLSAIAYALLDVAAAIREHTTAVEE